MSQQSYANHRQLVPVFHGVLFLMIVAGVIGAGVNLYLSLGDHQRLYSAALVFLIFLALLLMFYYVRVFPLRAQDRAIRAEENLRHYVLTGKLLDPSISVRQIVALRFASDAEFAALAQKAAREQLAPEDLKRAVQSWRADTYRV